MQELGRDNISVTHIANYTYFSSSTADTVSKSPLMSNTVSLPPGFLMTTSVGEGGQGTDKTKISHSSDAVEYRVYSQIGLKSTRSHGKHNPGTNPKPKHNTPNHNLNPTPEKEFT